MWSHLIGLCPLAVGAFSALVLAQPTAFAADARLADGIYFASSSGAGTPVERLDGQKIYFSGLATSGFGKPSLTSTTNDNSLYRLDLEGAGPFPDVAGPPHLALYLGGFCQSFVSTSDRRPDGSMDLTCYVPGDVAAKLAARLGIEPRARKHPGHQFVVRWQSVKRSYRAGEPVMVRLELTNVGQVTVRFHEGGRQRGARDNQFAFLAHHRLGYGQALPDTGDPQHHGGMAAMRTLGPGETFTKQVDVTKWFQFPEPDTYGLTCLYEVELSEPNVKYPIWDEYVVGKCYVTIKAPSADDGNTSRK